MKKFLFSLLTLLALVSVASCQKELVGNPDPLQGGPAVKATVSGTRQCSSIEIDPEVVDPEDIDMLQDLIISAVNEAVNNVESTTEAEMSKITGGVSLPGLF